MEAATSRAHLDLEFGTTRGGLVIFDRSPPVMLTLLTDLVVIGFGAAPVRTLQSPPLTLWGKLRQRLHCRMEVVADEEDEYSLARA